MTRLQDRGVRVDAEIVRYEAGNLVTPIDQDGLPTDINEFPPEMLDGDAPAVAGHDALVDDPDGNALYIRETAAPSEERRDARQALVAAD